MNERLAAKDKELREGHESYNSKLDQLIRDKHEEIRSLKSVIDEQSALISSSERITQREKSAHQEEIENLKQTNKSLKEEISALQTTNSSLNQKLTECQNEFNRIQEELQNNFVLDSERTSKLQEKSTRLERELIDRDVTISLIFSSKRLTME